MVNGGVLEASGGDSGSAAGSCRLGVISNDSPGACRAPARPHFPAGSRQEPLGPDRRPCQEVGGSFGFPQPVRVSWLRAGRACAGACIASGHAAAAPLSLPSRSAAPPTRLETRTKESNTSASQWVVKAQRRSESEGSLVGLRDDPARAQSPDFQSSSYVGNTQSISVGTRKMVNYAWPG